MARPPRDAFQIGWICALPIEAAAATQMLDEKFGILEEQDAADSNNYTLGRISKHYVVIACLPVGQYGTTSATTVANNMLRTFSKSLRIGLIVGIGGGIPSAAHDIRLGDVVISCPEGTCGGVIQYNMGKIIANGEFERTGSLNSPPRALLTTVGTIRAAGLTDDPHYPKYLQNAIRRTDRTRKIFGRPTANFDRLFRTKHDHPPSANSCDGCLVEWEETRDKREDNDPQPHYGIIASGNKVIKHGRTREQLRLETGALCFEMEAAGLMLDFPCLVIRGVCDYADSHKNKEWQGYAALAAAAYTKELLGYVPIGHISQESLVVDICNGLRAEIQSTNQLLGQAYSQQEQHHREKVAFTLTDQQNRCLQTFKISTYEEQKNINPRRVEGTCVWALQSSDYIRWSESTVHDLLWVSADPGCGKSVLARTIIDDYLEAPSQELTICYFFFKDNEEQNHLAAAMCSVLHQLFSQRPGLLRYAMPSWDRNGETLRHEIEELWRIFVTAASAEAPCQTICIFDALDECREVDQDRLIEKINLFRRQSSPSTPDAYLKFLITSRPYDYIQNHFKAMTKTFPHLHLKGEEDNDQIHKEIDIVVKKRVKELAETARLSYDTTRRLEQQLLQMGHRTYLWLHLAMDDIRSTFMNSLRPTKEYIRLIPPSVNAAYEKILDRVPPEQVEIVKKVLHIIVAARRPLTTREMAMALGTAISPYSRKAAESGLDSLLIGEKLRRLCGLFVFINNSKIYLIHQTAREFLIAKSSSNGIGFSFLCRLSHAEGQMAQICLRYLLMEDLVHDDNNLCSTTQAFLDYSAVHWPDHVRKMDLAADQIAVEQVHRLYDLKGELFSLWFPIFWKAAMPYKTLPAMKALHLAAFNGHELEVKSLLGVHERDVNVPDDTGTYAIAWASLNGYEKVVQILLDHGANANAQGGAHRNALEAACSEGHDKIVQLLLKRGADISTGGGKYALEAACSKGHDNIVRLLLEHGADVNAHSGDYGNAFHDACSEGHHKIVQILLDHGVDVNTQDGYYGYALQAACSNGHDKVVQLLLEHGADVNAQGGDYGNALQAACFEGHDKIVQLLLGRVANINARDGFSRNALGTACSEGHDKIVQILLDHGVDVNTQGGYYGNALQAACFKGHDKIVQLLLDRGADVNAQGGEYANALQATCFEGYDRILQLLLDRGADVNAQGGDYGCTLQAACFKGHDKIVQLLLDRGADVNAQGGHYGYALQAACSKGHDKIVQLLLEHGADVNAQGGHYGYALHAALYRGHEKISQLLLEKGADVYAQAGYYRNVLEAACYRGLDKIVQMLLERGAVDTRC